MSTVSGGKLLTAEEFGRLSDDGQLSELVRGRVVHMNMPAPRHGQVCVKVVRIVGNFVDAHDLGHVVCNDSGVITERDPDTVRGADVAFYSYARVPRGPFPSGYLDVIPELVFEVRSPDDRWRKILTKVAEYLEAGVSIVCVLDPETQALHVYYPEKPEVMLQAADELALPEVLAGFHVPVRQFFE